MASTLIIPAGSQKPHQSNVIVNYLMYNGLEYDITVTLIRCMSFRHENVIVTHNEEFPKID